MKLLQHMRRLRARAVLAILALATVAGCSSVRSRSDEFMRTGEFEKAVAIYEGRLAKDPGDVELRAGAVQVRGQALLQLIGRAMSLRSAGKLDEALATLERAKAFEAPGGTRVRDLMAGVLTERRQSEALRSAEALLKEKKTNQALRVVLEALKDQPTHAGLQQLQRQMETDLRHAQLRTARAGLDEQRPITLDFRDASLRNVLDVVTRHSGLNFVIDKDVRPDIMVSIFVRGAKVGVGLLTDADQARADFSKWTIDLARETGSVVVVDTQGARWWVAADPWDERLHARASAIAGVYLSPAAAHGTTLRSWLSSEPESEAVSPAARTRRSAADDPNSSVVAFVDRAISAACALAASDIHFESDRKGVQVKHRLDGLMVPYARLEGEAPAEEVISRIKVLAQLDITERRLPQDGRFRWEMAGEGIDLRVSIMPSIFGEDAVLRLLDKAQLRGARDSMKLEGLGFEASQASQIRAMAHEPSGLILVTGPTGSGKTTTLYAALSEINDGTEKIITIEDPVEYELPGVLQIPVNERKGLTFAKGLRSILRHDPDRILVGEIRDAETAEIAVQAALTGHMVFTTVHANSMSDIIGRFRHFELDMFGLMSSLNGVVVQRLVRRLCPHCKASRPLEPDETRWLRIQGASDVRQVPLSRGCQRCHDTGYSGRFVIAEIHRVDDEFRDMVTQGAALTAIKAHAIKSGVSGLQRQAAQSVVAGLTTIEEVRRVVGSSS